MDGTSPRRVVQIQRLISNGTDSISLVETSAFVKAMNVYVSTSPTFIDNKYDYVIRMGGKLFYCIMPYNLFLFMLF